MKTDLNSLKKELSKLTDIKYLKKELNRLTGEIKKFDLHLPLTPQARTTLTQLEKRFREVLASLSDLQKQVDDNLVKFRKIIAKSQNEATKRFRAMGLSQKTAKATTKKAAPKSGASKSAKTSKKSAGQSSGVKKTSRKTAKKA